MQNCNSKCLLGNNITTLGWPRCGEIDIIEMIGGNGREKEVHGTLHWDNGGHASSADIPETIHHSLLTPL